MQQPASQPKPIPPRSDPTCSLRSSANCMQDCTGPGAPVVIEVALGANIAGLPEGSDTRARFQVSLMRDLSTILKVSGERVLYLPPPPSRCIRLASSRRLLYAYVVGSIGHCTMHRHTHQADVAGGWHQR